MPFDQRASVTAITENLVVAGTVVTASGNTPGSSGYGPGKTIRAQLNVTAASGTTPTLDVVIEDSIDGVNFNTVGTFTQATAVSRQVINITTPFADFLRVRYTVAGTTPSFTFGVEAFIEGGSGA